MGLHCRPAPHQEEGPPACGLLYRDDPLHGDLKPGSQHVQSPAWDQNPRSGSHGSAPGYRRIPHVLQSSHPRCCPNTQPLLRALVCCQIYALNRNFNTSFRNTSL